jgi:riboflavin synthase
MFTGIVEETGRVASADRRGGLLVARITARLVMESVVPGGSIAVDGCCLTAVDVDGQGFTCALTGETLARTAFAERLRPGARVNLERPMRADGRFDGHIVQGHVDGVGIVRALRRQGDGVELEVTLPADLERYVVEKGSIAVDGVSLTVAGVSPGVFRAALIPYTLEHTSLGQAHVGGPVNLEVDVIAKYVESLLGAARR